MNIILEKARSRQRIEIITDTKDDWFLYVTYIEKNTEKPVHSSMIIRKDLPNWITYLGTMGWKEKKGA